MKPHPRIRKTIKWGGAAVTVLLVVVWIGSAWCEFGWWIRKDLVSGCWAGTFVLQKANYVGPPPAVFLLPSDGSAFQWWFVHRGYGSSNAYAWLIRIPLWFPILVALIATLLAVRLDALARRRLTLLSLCPKCNYDREGLAAGAVCPECGRLPT